MRVAVRCDGGDAIGAGHVSRCLQIAVALERRGVECVFVGTYDGAAEELIAAAGIDTAEAADPGPLGVPADADAVVVDHYGITVERVAEAALDLPVAAIVDLGSPPAGATVLGYHLVRPTGLGSEDGHLLGPAYAPIDPVFAAARRPLGSRNVLVTVGGSRVGAAALETALALLDREHRWNIHVASRERPAALPAGARWSWEPGGLAGLAEWSDLAITAAGATPYELACAGVPSLLITVADNQIPVARGFADVGLAHAADARSGIDVAELDDLWQDTVARATDLALAGPLVVDGAGALRAADGLLAAFAGGAAPEPLLLRPGTAADGELLLGWRNDERTRAMSRSQATVTPEEHRGWLESVLADADRTLLVVSQAGVAVGNVRFDRDHDESEINVAIAPEHRRAGLGSRAIAEATELELASRPGLRRVVAEVREDNGASLSAFARAGYVRLADRGRGGGVMLSRTFD